MFVINARKNTKKKTTKKKRGEKYHNIVHRRRIIYFVDYDWAIKHYFARIKLMPVRKLYLNNVSSLITPI